MQRIILFLGFIGVLLVGAVRCSSPASPAAAPAVPATSPTGATAVPATNNTPPDSGVVPVGVVIPTTYSTFCSSCHGAQGEGSAVAPGFDGAALRAMTAADLRQIISTGVPGTAMIGWERALNATQIEELVQFCSSLKAQSWLPIPLGGLPLTPLIRKACCVRVSRFMLGRVHRATARMAAVATVQ